MSFFQTGTFAKYSIITGGSVGFLGLLGRTCASAGKAAIIPLCSSGTGTDSLVVVFNVHCLGCYVAAAGFAIAAAGLAAAFAKGSVQSVTSRLSVK